MTKYKPDKDLPDFARAGQTLSPSALVKEILDRRNTRVTPESVTMWFKRHPEVYEQLQREIVKGLPTEKEAVTPATFETANFESLPSVKNWILYMRTRRRKGKPLHPDYIKSQVGLLRWACKMHSVPKHPDRLTFRDAQEIFLELEEKGMDTYQQRRAIKDFLKSKGTPEWEKIGVGAPRGKGKYRELFVERETIYLMLGYIATRDYEVFVADKIMWHNGLRLNAVLMAEIEKFKVKPEGWSKLTVLEKFRTVLTFDLVPSLTELIKDVIGDRKSGQIFNITERRINILNREALRKFCPDLEPKIKMPSHFFRHMCAQHLKKLVGSRKAAAIMQTTEASFIESYGGDPAGDVAQWTRETLPMLDPDFALKG